jgi:hypothetical protein
VLKRREREMGERKEEEKRTAPPPIRGTPNKSRKYCENAYIAYTQMNVDNENTIKMRL